MCSVYMQGGTPAYLMPLFCFEHLMDCWDSPGHLTNPNHQSASNTSSQPASPNAPNPAGAATALVNGTKEASHEAQAPHAVSHSNSHDTQEPEPAARAAQSTVSAGHTVITVTDVHSHVMGLQARFVAGLEAMGGSGGAEPLLSVSRLVNWRDMSVETRSHTLVFQFASATEVGMRMSFARACRMSTRQMSVRAVLNTAWSYMDKTPAHMYAQNTHEWFSSSACIVCVRVCVCVCVCVPP